VTVTATVIKVVSIALTKFRQGHIVLVAGDRPLGARLLPLMTTQLPVAGCKHFTTTVKPGETRLYRLINAGTLMYQTVCFEQHAVTIVAADAYPTQHVHTECVDVNAGQR